MKRRHLFELEDQQWFPTTIRNYGTDFLQFVANQFDFYKDIIPLLQKGIEKSGTSTVVDLASGGGGGWDKIGSRLQAVVPDVQVVFTDYYPNLDAFKAAAVKHPALIDYESEPVDALDVPVKLKGLRTQFLSFHHFKPAAAQQILQNAVDSGAPIAIFEAQERSILQFIQFLFSPINVLLTTPFIRPFKLGRILFTYLIPIVPLFVLWDGLVSVLRTYTLDEMRTMTTQLQKGDGYEWEIGELKNGPMKVLYLLGYPKDA